MPTRLGEPSPFQALAEAGVYTVTYSFDLGCAWDEGKRIFMVSPAIIEFESLFSLSATLAIANAPRDVFVLNRAKFELAANVLEAGPIRLSLRDTGAVELLVAQFAKNRGMSPATARSTMIDNIRNNLAAQTQFSPDAQALNDAIISFMAKPGQTLTIGLNPRSRINLVQAMQSMQAGPIQALSGFDIETRVSR
jgi:hypothetical protein